MSQSSRYPLKGVTPNINNLKVFKNSCASGDLDEPSIRLDLLGTPIDGAVLTELQKWFSNSGQNFGEIQFNFGRFGENEQMLEYGIITNNKELQLSMQSKLSHYLQLFLPRAAPADAYILRGTICINSQMYFQNPKIVDQFLKGVMVNAPNLRKLNISYNYISGSTFDLLAKVLEAAPLLRELDISGCILGTCPLILTQEIKLQMESLSCCGRCDEWCNGKIGCGCCCLNCGCCQCCD